MKPIEMPIAAVCWVSLVAFVLVHNWGWWRSGVFGFWEALLMPVLFSVLMLGVVAVGLFAAAFGVSCWIGTQAKTIWVPGWHEELASLRNADGVHGEVRGSVFMVIGSLDSAEIYYYYTTDGPGRYKPHHWRPDGDTTIIEEDRAGGEVQQWETGFLHPWVSWVALPNDRIRMDFHIPKGSLVRDYKMK